MKKFNYVRIINNKNYDYGYLYDNSESKADFIGFLVSKKNSGIQEGTYKIVLKNEPKDFMVQLNQFKSLSNKGIPSLEIRNGEHKEITIPIMYANKEFLVSRNTILYSSKVTVVENKFELENSNTYTKFYDLISKYSNDKIVLTIQDVNITLTIHEDVIQDDTERDVIIKSDDIEEDEDTKEDFTTLDNNVLNTTESVTEEKKPKKKSKKKKEKKDD